MSVEKVREYLAGFGLSDRVLEFSESTATVELAARVNGVSPGEIAKSLTFKVEEKPVMIIAAGDAKVDNHKFKEFFHTKAKMLSHEEVPILIGHEVGGVCPFALKEGVSVYLDGSLKRFKEVRPAAGNDFSAVRLSLDELERASKSLGWIDVCKLPEVKEE